MSKVDSMSSRHVQSVVDASASRDAMVASWKSRIESSGSKNASASREVLASVNTNLGGPSTGKPVKGSSVNSIPRPAVTPDVFAPDVLRTTHHNETRSPSTPLHSAGKRPRDVASPNLFAGIVKRAKANGTDAGLAAPVGEPVVRSARAEEEKWRAKWVKVFPTLVFHFEIGADEGQGKTLRNRVMRMGAKVDQFFSTRVTHLIVRGGQSPQKPKPLASSRRNENARDSTKIQNPFLDGTGVTDLVQKAEAMNMKVWTVKKLVDILGRIAPVETANNDSLSTLLEDEKLHGTRERDFSAPRPDYYYFKPGNKYLLVEDATGKHRTVMVKEYCYNQKEGPEWPTLFDSFLRVSSSMQSSTPVEKIRDRAWSLYVDRKPFEGEQPPHDLRRSTSLRVFPSTPKLPEAQPYHDASGNSVTLTSATASTSTAGTPVYGGYNGLHSNKDRAIVQMSRRVQVLKGNARLAAASRQHDSDVDPPAQIESSGPSRRLSAGFSQPAKTFMTQDQVIKMLQQAREPLVDPSITAQARMRNREKVDMGLKGREQDTAPGYCENCRLRYTDLSVHVASKKHRRFAMNNENFEELDQLLYALQRPLHPSSIILPNPPCNVRHTRDTPCDACDRQLVPLEDDLVCGEEDDMSGEDGEEDLGYTFVHSEDYVEEA
ncbi:hypothetical protein IAU60_003570 [Kwoniella sp. DSM 27419]